MNEGGLNTRSEIQKWRQTNTTAECKAIEEQGDQTTPGKRDRGKEIWTACQAETATSNEKKWSVALLGITEQTSISSRYNVYLYVNKYVNYIELSSQSSFIRSL